MLTEHHLFHAVAVTAAGVYLEVEVIDNAAINRPTGVGLHLSSNSYCLLEKRPKAFDAIGARLNRNERYQYDTPSNRREVLGIAEDVVRSIERDYKIHFLRGVEAGLLRQTLFALGEYRREAMLRLPAKPTEMWVGLNARLEYELAQRARKRA